MKLFLIFLGIFIIFIFIEPIFEDVFNIATIIGSMGGAVPLLLGLAWHKINIIPRNILTAVYFVGFLVLLLAMIFILLNGKTKAAKQEVIIVLGCSVKGDKPSLSLIKRVDTAFDYLSKNKNAVAVLSGGQGPDENISEALCMFNMLSEKGIDENRLITEDKSTTTDENIRFSKKLMNTSEAAIATSEYHQLRAKIICKRYGIKAYAKSSHTKLTILPTFLLREVLGIIKELFLYIKSKMAK